jgi:phosphotransferase system HPr (HPr) family protein
MQSKKLIVRNEHGMHGRVALHVAQKSQMLDAQVTLRKGSDVADCCSVLQLLMLSAQQGAELELTVTGKDEQRGLAEIAEIFSEGAGI